MQRLKSESSFLKLSASPRTRDGADNCFHYLFDTGAEEDSTSWPVVTLVTSQRSVVIFFRHAIAQARAASREPIPRKTR